MPVLPSVLLLSLLTDCFFLFLLPVSYLFIYFLILLKCLVNCYLPLCLPVFQLFLSFIRLSKLDISSTTAKIEFSLLLLHCCFSLFLLICQSVLLVPTHSLSFCCSNVFFLLNIRASFFLHIFCLSLLLLLPKFYGFSSLSASLLFR